MTHPPDHVEVVCSRCGTVFTASLQPHSDHEPEGVPEGSGVREPTACPECGTVPQDGDRLQPVSRVSA
jgi:hypothetical protein